MDDRRQIDLPLVRSLIDSQFPAWRDLPLRPVPQQGWDNATFRLGSALGVRLPTASRYVSQVEKEQRWLPHLARHLSLEIPTCLALGEPQGDYPFPWSVRRWIEGDPPSVCETLARDLAGFLKQLHAADPAGGPPPGTHSFHRGGNLAAYDAETRALLPRQAESLWQAALDQPWTAGPVWVHGDVAPGNLLVRDGRLAAVIDFGCCAVGDPACDLVMAWTSFDGPTRTAFQTAVQMDDATWARARGWALWKALLIRAGKSAAKPDERPADIVIADLLAGA